MKKVYIPTEEELYKLQSFGVNIYNYILAKTIETLIMTDVIFDEENIFDIAYEELSEFPEIIYTMCKLYPERIGDSIITTKDINLCRILTEKLPSQDKKVYYLDNLAYFDQESDILLDSIVVKNTTKILAEKLSPCPKYRFDYRDNILLDSIFSCELPISEIMSETKEHLMTIDPIYIVKLDDIETDKKGNLSQKMFFSLTRALLRYTDRFGTDITDGLKYQNKDILNNPDEKVKKLIRCLDEHRKYNI